MAMRRLARARRCHRAGGSRGGEMAETISPRQRSARLQPQPIMTTGAKLSAIQVHGNKAFATRHTVVVVMAELCRCG
jgi:hypothetical protein